MTHRLYINKSGIVYPMYEVQENFKKYGDIVNREAYVYIGHEGALYALAFLTPSGVFRNTTVSCTSYPFPNGFMASCLNYPYGRATINGTTYYTFIMRQAKSVYKADGSYWGSVASGRRVATTNNIMGDSHYDWKQINYVENTNGQWIQVSGNGSDYGYVDTGIASASGYGGIAMYGSW